MNPPKLLLGGRDLEARSVVNEPATSVLAVTDPLNVGVVSEVGSCFLLGEGASSRFGPHPVADVADGERIAINELLLPHSLEEAELLVGEGGEDRHIGRGPSVHSGDAALPEGEKLASETSELAELARIVESGFPIRRNVEGELVVFSDALIADVPDDSNNAVFEGKFDAACGVREDSQFFHFGRIGLG